jgi:hypothetical protein
MVKNPLVFTQRINKLLAIVSEMEAATGAK